MLVCSIQIKTRCIRASTNTTLRFNLPGPRCFDPGRVSSRCTPDVTDHSCPDHWSTLRVKELSSWVLYSKATPRRSGRNYQARPFGPWEPGRMEVRQRTWHRLWCESVAPPVKRSSGQHCLTRRCLLLDKLVIFWANDSERPRKKAKDRISFAQKIHIVTKSHLVVQSEVFWTLPLVTSRGTKGVTSNKGSCP